MSAAIDGMCTLPKSSSPGKSSPGKTPIDIIVNIECDQELLDQPHQDEASQEQKTDSDGSTGSESRVLQTVAPPADSCDPLPGIPFSKTFRKSEKLKKKESDSPRKSLNSEMQTPLRRHNSGGEQYLRRRARSSEGYLLRKNRNGYFNQDSNFDSENNGGNIISIPSLSTESEMDEIRRRITFKGPSPRHGNDSNECSNDDRNKNRRRLIIPLEHPFKIAWDVSTVILSIAHSYLTHMAIRDRRFEASPFIFFCQAWFLIDILLNFFTERKTSTGEIIYDHRRIVARYLTTWFAVDILSLLPWEVLYVQPLIDVQNRRGFFKKSFFRSKAVVRVTRHLRGRHFRWFGTVAKHTKHHGIGAQRLLRLIIKYVPKYIMFLRNMKGVVAMRILRFVHWSRRSISNIESKVSDVSANNTSGLRRVDHNFNSEYDDGPGIWQAPSFDTTYEWEKIDDDGVPL